MTQAARPCRPHDGPYAAGSIGRILLAGILLAVMVLWLRSLGRPWICPCGSVFAWYGGLGAEHNSRHLADWYSLAHVTYGIGLFLLVDRTAPRWPTGRKALTALASSAVWEAIENTPFVIALFGDSPNAPHYSGDSVLNASGDTLFVMVGFLLAWRLPLRALALLAIGLEASMILAIDDGIVVGALRLLRVDI